MIQYGCQNWISAGLLFLYTSLGWSQVKIYQEMMTDEKELKVKVSFAAGLIEMRKSDENVIYRLKADVPNNDVLPTVRYSKNGSTGYLAVSMDSDNSLDIFDVGDIKWVMEITSAVPVFLQADMGACKGRLDMTDIRLKDCNLMLGASTLHVLFDTPNRERIRKLSVDAGLSKLKMYGLRNANFEEMDFEGGVGAFILNFGGISKLHSKVFIELGVGKLSLEFPKFSNVKLKADNNIFTSFWIDKELFDSENGDLYTTKNYNNGLPGMNVQIDAGLGNIRVISVP